MHTNNEHEPVIDGIEPEDHIEIEPKTEPASGKPASRAYTALRVMAYLTIFPALSTMAVAMLMSGIFLAFATMADVTRVPSMAPMGIAFVLGLLAVAYVVYLAMSLSPKAKVSDRRRSIGFIGLVVGYFGGGLLSLASEDVMGALFGFGLSGTVFALWKVSGRRITFGPLKAMAIGVILLPVGLLSFGVVTTTVPSSLFESVGEVRSVSDQARLKAEADAVYYTATVNAVFADGEVTPAILADAAADGTFSYDNKTGLISLNGETSYLCITGVQDTPCN